MVGKRRKENHLEIPFFVRMRRQLARARNNVDADAADQPKGRSISRAKNLSRSCFISVQKAAARHSQYHGCADLVIDTATSLAAMMLSFLVFCPQHLHLGNSPFRKLFQAVADLTCLHQSSATALFTLTFANRPLSRNGI